MFNYRRRANQVETYRRITRLRRLNMALASVDSFTALSFAPKGPQHISPGQSEAASAASAALGRQ